MSENTLYAIPIYLALICFYLTKMNFLTPLDKTVSNVVL